MFENLRRSTSERARYPDTPPQEYPSFARAGRRASRDLTSYFRHPFNARDQSPPARPVERRLTSILIESTPEQLKAATRHPFLKAAGQGKVSKDDLSRWLSQDRLYAETYISFISSLIARVTLPYAFVDSKDKSLRWRIIILLTEALQNIHRELEFFSETAKKYDLALDEPWIEDASTFEPNPVTEQYISLFTSFHLDPQQSLLEGLLVLWATEKCYLDAWTYASTYLESSSDENADGGALKNEFIPNWSSTEFVKFVDEIANVTDALANRENALKKIEVLKALWLHVLDIEQGFWPNIDTE